MPQTDASALPETMRAVRCHGPMDYRLATIATPRAAADEILVRIEASGVCASDGKCHSGAPMFWGDDARPRYVEPPVTPGHEFVGVVAEIGETAAARTGLSLGDRAIAEQIVPCTQCRYCRMGSYWLCARNDVFGFHQSVQGSMAEYMVFPATSIVHSVPQELPIEQAALIEPLACSMRAVERSNMQLGDVVVIAGTGTLGLGMISAARLRNPGLLIAMDRIGARLEVAQQLGADMTLNPADCDAVTEVRKLTEGYGCDVYIEATGHPDAVNQGLHMVRRGGTFVEFSVMARETCTDWTIIGDSKELNVYGAHLGPGCYPKVIDYLRRGLLRTDGIVTHTLPLESFDAAFELVHDGRQSIKVLLKP